MRSLTVAMDGSLVVAANNSGTCYVWRALRGSYLTTHFEPLHKLRAHQGGREGQRRALIRRGGCVRRGLPIPDEPMGSCLRAGRGR